MSEVGMLRLAAQRVAGDGMETVAAAVRWMTAMQAQDLPGVLTSTALRTTSGTRAAVEAALDAGEVVRSWPMRGTLHLVASEDLPWLLELCTPRVVSGAASRRARLGLDIPALERARQVAIDALTGGRRLSRDDLFAAWAAAGLDTDRQRGYHMLWHLAQTGTLCLGPVRGGDQLIVLVDEWIPRPRRLERDEALGELALRYFRSHGPATVKDFIRWTGLTATDARAGVALARPELASMDVDGAEHLLDPRTPQRVDACRDGARGMFLLPGFDEFVLGYADRGAVIAPEHADLLVPGGNGVFRPTVVCDGRIVGTWRHTGRGAKRSVAATAFTAFDERTDRAIAASYASLPG